MAAMETDLIITMELRGLSGEQNAVLPCMPYVSSDPASPNGNVTWRHEEIVAVPRPALVQIILISLVAVGW